MKAKVVQFVFVREGTSDDGLLPHLRQLVVRAGASEAIGTSRAYKGTVVDRLSAVAAELASLDLVFVHRDSDSRNHAARYAEIEDAVTTTKISVPVVSVVPVQELEAWLLVDEGAIRTVVGKPRGSADLSLPKLSKVENTSQPKELLQAALLMASETSGRRRERETKAFSQRRRALLERLDPDGLISGLPAWQRLWGQVQTVVSTIIENA